MNLFDVLGGQGTFALSNYAPSDRSVEEEDRGAWLMGSFSADLGQVPLSVNFGVRVAGGGDTDMCMPVTHSTMFTGIFGSHRISCRVTSIANRAGDWHPFTIRNVRLSVFGGKR